MPSYATAKSPRRILVTGTAGTGRRSLGAVLALERGFRHVDDRVATSAGRSELVRALVQRLDVVVTWTGALSAPSPHMLRSLDFDVVWLDGDRGAAQPPGTRFVDPFAADGSYRPLGMVVDELLSPAGESGRSRREARATPRA